MTGTDIFQAFSLVNEIQKKFYEDDEASTLMLGTYGAQAEIAGTILERAMIVASEVSTEAIPTKAKYEKNVIAHARFVGISDIYATPARMRVYIYIPRKQVDNNLKQNKWVLDKDCKLLIGGFEFHLDYDIIITRNRIKVGEYVYTAIYDMTRNNPLASDISTPNIPPIGIFKTNTEDMLGLACYIRQIEQTPVYKKIMTDNIIENKTIEFEYHDQLAAFDIDVKEGDDVYHILPVYDGTIVTTGEKYCEYQDIDSKTIRLKFNRDSYMPRINADVTILVKTTKGEEGVFPYKEDTISVLNSDRYGYSGIPIMIRPIADSEYGVDRKSVAELRAMIPKEALSRGSIISTTDLQHFFNATNLKDSKIYFYKQKYNQLEHCYHAYLLMKYNNIIVPTNTMTVDITTDKMQYNGKGWYISPLSTFVLGTDGIARIVDDAKESEETPFVYTNPFMININKTPIVTSYYLTIFNSTKYLDFTFINSTSTLQFVISNMQVKRSGFTNVDDYFITVDMQQNINTDMGLAVKDEEGNITEYKLKAFLAFYTETTDGTMYRYCEGEIVDYIPNSFTYTAKFKITTDNTIDQDNRIKLTNLIQPVSGLQVDSYISNNIPALLIVMAKTDVYYGDGGLGEYIKGTEGYSLCNKYGVKEGMEFFYNYTQMMTSTPVLNKIEGDDTRYRFTIDKVPMIRSSFISNEMRMSSVIKEIQSRKQYIDYCLNVLEDGFDIDLKFFNTYGPSVRYTIDKEDRFINHTNLSVTFRTKLYSNSEKYIIDIIKQEIKTTVEDMDKITDIHFTNVADTIYQKYRDQLEYFEFVEFNGYGTGWTHIYQIADNVKADIPEFLNINTLLDDSPDITIMED